MVHPVKRKVIVHHHAHDELRHLDNVDRAVEQVRPCIAKFGYNQEDVRS